MKGEKTMAKKIEKIWIAQLDRFGYNLTAAGRTEAEAVRAILKDYKEAYERYNGSDPAKDLSDRPFAEEGQTALDVAKEDMITWTLDIGNCTWM